MRWYVAPHRSSSSAKVAGRNSRLGEPSNFGPTSSVSRLRLMCVNGMAAILVPFRVRTSVRMTSQGHGYARFRRALESGNAHVALAAAAELCHVGLVDALSL